MKTRMARLVLAALLSFFTVCVVASCNNSGDDDDDDDGVSYGEDISGTYIAQMTYDVDTCSPGNEDNDPVEWIIEIEQSGDLSEAWVKYQETGVGEMQELFKGTVYGNVVIKAGIDTRGVGADCAKINVEDLQIRVDIENKSVYGSISKDIFYQGGGCDSSTIDCFYEQSFLTGE
jgi:hypothetical protein